MDYALEPRNPATQPRGVVDGYPQTAQRWPAQALVRPPAGMAPRVGPGAVTRRLGAVRADLAGQGARRAIGQLIHVRTRVMDEDGTPLPGAVVEIWHCNAAGKYIHPNDRSDAPEDPNFYGAARVVADADGVVQLRTIKPAAYAVPDSGGWWRPPHIHFSVWGRLWLSRLVTQMFFPGEPLNEHDAILNAVRDPRAREACVARLAPTRGGPADALVFDYDLVVRGRKAAPSLP